MGKYQLFEQSRCMDIPPHSGQVGYRTEKRTNEKEIEVRTLETPQLIDLFSQATVQPTRVFYKHKNGEFPTGELRSLYSGEQTTGK